jgi:ABC-2 type transport system ATP-binding protein
MPYAEAREELTVSDQYAIEATGLGKSYARVEVLADLDLRIPRGSVYALLGPNGAGKTTTVKILSTLLRPNAGTATVAGFDVATRPSEVRRRISLTSQEAALDDLQTGVENLRMMARLRGLSHRDARRRATELLEEFGLTDAGGRRVNTYSGGMRRRLDLAAGLVSRPEVLFLDEPTTGLDPRSRQAVWASVRELARDGVTVLLTTQYLEEADQLADRVAVIDHGRLVAEGTAADLKSQVAEQRLDLHLTDSASYDALLVRLADRALGADAGSLTISLATDGSAGQVRALLDELDPDGRAVTRFALRTATLDDVFLALTHTEKEIAHV